MVFLIQYVVLYAKGDSILRFMDYRLKKEEMFTFAVMSMVDVQTS